MAPAALTVTSLRPIGEHALQSATFTATAAQPAFFPAGCADSLRVLAGLDAGFGECAAPAGGVGYVRIGGGAHVWRGAGVCDWVERWAGRGSRANAVHAFLEELGALGAMRSDWVQVGAWEAACVDVALAVAIGKAALVLDGTVGLAGDSKLGKCLKHAGIVVVWGNSADGLRDALQGVDVSMHERSSGSVPKMQSRRLQMHSWPVWRFGLVSASTIAIALMPLMALLPTTANAATVLQRAAVAISASVREASNGGAVYIGNGQLATLGVVLLGVAFASSQMSLNIERELVVSSLRCLVQLSMLGLILVPIFSNNSPALVLSYLAFMLCVAAGEATGRPPYVYPALFWVCLSSLTLSAFVFGVYLFKIVINKGLEAQYTIPLSGMLIGSAMSAISVSVSNVVRTFAERKDNIETLLALGATRWEATLDIIRSSVVLGLTPTLNQMSVTGLVSLPGMLTGAMTHNTA